MSAISAMRDVNHSPVRGIILMLFTGESNYVFASVAFQIQKNRNFIKIKAIFYKEIAQFTILVAFIGNKMSKCFFLTSLLQILYISTRQTYRSGKFNSRDSVWYDLFSFSDTSDGRYGANTCISRLLLQRSYFYYYNCFAVFYFVLAFLEENIMILMYFRIQKPSGRDQCVCF